jgi:hypothetical protein
MGQELKVEPGAKVNFKDYDPDYTGKYKSEEETLDELNKLKDQAAKGELDPEKKKEVG